ncbi:DUF368 domain-containing protein [Alkalihalobacterium bogoriense]|uniref:DUF368 domain-containing protein n=1 Tax=Alkalihalobacterium bogoriense TaxID=246272 RepID=UPI0004794EE3|nr:DUF368 domain-containing protein [Alkalihalobacterium bogoriense]
MEWKNIYRGMMIGTSDIVPGVSGGTIAVLLGIYDRLIAAISGFFSREWKKHFGFLFPLGVGAVLAVFLLSHLIEWLIEFHFQATMFFFLGLIGGILPYLLRDINYKETFRAPHYVTLVIAGLVIASTAFIGAREDIVIESYTLSSALVLFGSGFVASMAMILPGISGSFVLLLLGTYEPVLGAVTSLNIPMIATVAIGILLGLVLCSKAITYLLKRMPVFTYAFIIGIVAGSMVVIFPGIEPNFIMLFTSVVTFIVGFYVAVTLGKVEHT